MYDRIKEKLKELQQALYSSHATSTTPLPLEGEELGDEPT
jgi:hypothetical protein